MHDIHMVVVCIKSVRRFTHGGRVCAMRMRGSAAVVVIALIAAGCGRSTASRSAGVHLDGKRAPGTYVLETDGSGAQFLVPAAVVASQGSQAFDVSAPTSVTVAEPANTATLASPPYRSIVSFANATVPHATRVEILATGEPGRRFELSWTETCGWTQEGKGAAGGTGGEGTQILRSPAVMLVRLPRIGGGVPSCYLAATAATTTFTRGLRLMIIDY
jgi:hypothetical protein